MSRNARDRVRLLLAGNDDSVRRDLRMALSGFKWIKLCGEIHDRKEAVAKAVELKPDVLLVVFGSGNENRLVAIQEIRDVSANVEIIILGENDGPHTARAVLDAGATAYIPMASVWISLMSVLRQIEGKIRGSKSR